MQEMQSMMRRLVSFVETMPEVCANDIRFRVPFVLPRWFRMPRRIRVAGRWVALQFPGEAGVDADLLTCLFRNTYGLGHGLGTVRTIVDVGANLGFFALAAREHYPAAVIHAYEPNPRIQAMLHANTDGLRVAVYAEAVGDRDGTGQLLDDGPSNQARLTPDSGAVTVPMVSLETVLERVGSELDLLKLDCEGAEWEILRPGPGWARVRHIRMEYHLFRGETAEEAQSALVRLGFRVTRVRRYSDRGGAIWARREAGTGSGKEGAPSAT